METFNDIINSPKFFEIIENQKINYLKKQHLELRTKNVHLSIFPTHFKKIVNLFKHVVNNNLRFASSNDINTEYNKQIYFYNVNVVHQYYLPEDCTILIVAELFDENGLISSFETAN